MIMTVQALMLDISSKLTTTCPITTQVNKTGKVNLSFLSHSRRNRVIISTDEDCISLKEIDPYLIGYKRLLTDSKKRL